MKNNIHKLKRISRGFTLVELLIYLGIVAVVVNTLVIFGLNIINAGMKSTRQEEVQSAASFLAEKIKYEARNADDINISSSNFGINLADSPGTKISFKESGAGDPTTLDVSAGNGRISRGSASPVTLNPAGTKITNLTFLNLSSSTGSTKQIQFTLTVVSLYPSPGNIYESTTLESSAELRSHL